MADAENGEISLSAKKKRRDKSKTDDEKMEHETEVKKLKLDSLETEPVGNWNEDMDHHLLRFVDESCAQLQRNGPKFIFAKHVKWKSIAERFHSEAGLSVEPKAVKSRWDEMTKKVRRVRTVPELLEDVQKHFALHLDSMPKKPSSSYLLFYNSKRARTAEKYPSLSFAELNRKIGQKWREMPTENKSKYEKKANKEKEKYKEELEEWEAAYPEAIKAMDDKKRKDPLPAQKNMSPFDVFVEKKSAELLLKHPDLEAADLEEKLKRRWEKLKEHKRQKYTEEAEALNKEPKKMQQAAAKKRQARGPATPKKPPTAYNLYCKTQRELLLKENPDLDFGSISKMTGQGWKERSTEENKKYQDQATILKENYLQKVKQLQDEQATNS